SDLVEVVVKPSGVEGSLAENVWQVYVVDRQHLADHVEHAVGQHGTHLVEFFEEAFEYAAFHNWLAFLRCAGHKIEGVNVPSLANTVDTAKTLLQSRRVPGKVVVDHQPAELQVDAFARRLGGNTDLLLSAELFLGAFSLVRIHPAVDFANSV